MANTLVTSVGSINNTSSTPLALGTAYDTKYATYLKLFTGEMMKAYESACIAKGTVMSRSLRGGKSAQFIFTGRMTAAYHEPGTPILGSNNPPVAEKTIVMDDLLVSSAFVYDLDETLAHYSLRSEISAKIGHALAEAYDKKIFRQIAKAAREAHPITAAPGPEPGGSIIQLGVQKEYDAQALVDGFFEAASIMDEKNLPKQGRHAVLSPRQYYALISQVDTNILNRDYGSGQGNLNSGEGLYEIAGISIKRSNNLPFLAGSISSVNGENNDYSGDFSTSCGLIYQKDAVGVVEAIGPQVQTTGSDVRTMYQGDIIVGRLAMGAGTLNPAAAIELQSARS
ncbi:major capsid protein [Synechococcus phage S-CBP4]|uniref:Major capsid protein n=1 Tax=Synechococcus phage S-CBP4 TaxID=754059 RepID=M1Q780_9CAUD|nr:major head protein [Synechococcus phage S-CBP4]YP_009822208.1 major head protein [Synechococcus phage S-CBP4]AGF91708.1 major capsid protein [Synechococcus phage S-CBP4]AGK86635.1 major capsid protein [Synechococcus phage S-CBP4]